MTQLALTATAPIEDRRFVDEFREVLATFRRGWHYIAVASLVGVTAAALYVVQIKPIYKSTARLLILQQGGSSLNQVVTGKDYFAYAADDIPTHLMVLGSPSILRRAVESARVKDLSLATVQSRLTVSRPDPGVKILEVGYQAPAAQEANQVVDAVVASYRKFLEENYQKSTTDVLALIAKVRDELSDELRKLEQKYLDFHRRNPVFAVSQDGRSLLVRRLDQWDAEANEAMLRTVKLQSQLELARKLSSEGMAAEAIGNTVRLLGNEDGLALAGLGADVPQGSPGAELAAVQRQVRTTQRLLDHLRAESAFSAAAVRVTEAEVQEAFYAEPEAADLRDQLSAARHRHDSIKRTTRSSGDPALSTARRRLLSLQAEHDRLWQRRRGAIADFLARDAGSEIEAVIRREQANLIVLQSRESVLREELLTLQESGDRQPPEGQPQPLGVAAICDTIERAVRASDALRVEMTRRFKEDLAAGKETELLRLEEEGLRANLDRHRALFNSVVDQLKQAQLVSDHTMITAQTISPAAAIAVMPRRMYTLLAALGISCCVGATLAYVVDLFDARLRTLPALRRGLDFSVLGLVPELPAAKLPAVGDLGLISHSLPHSPVAEAFRSIRTNLELQRRHRQVQVVLITSPHAEDGKSTTASNLAISLAHAGNRVLLVDADLRRPKLHSIHERHRSSGLANVLKAAQAWEDETERSAVENLDLLAAGPRVSNPAELLGSKSFHAFLDSVRRAYDLILIDSSPLLAVTDPLLIGGVADGVILVARAAALRRHEAERTTELLESIDTPVLGIVVNRFTRDQVGYGPGQGYGYEYAHRYGSDQIDAEEDGLESDGDGGLDSRRLPTPVSLEGS